MQASVQGVVLDFIDEKKCRNVINHTLFDQGNFLAPGGNQITVSAPNSIPSVQPFAGNSTMQMSVNTLPTM